MFKNKFTKQSLKHNESEFLMLIERLDCGEKLIITVSVVESWKLLK